MGLNRAFVDILEVREDRFGPYAKVKVACADGDAIIRWGLDGITFDNLLQAVKEHTQGSASEADRLCKLSVQVVSGEHENHNGQLVVWKDDERFHVTFFCSPLFVSNAIWLSQVQSVAELVDVRWIDDEMQDVTPVESTEQTVEEPTIAPKERKTRARKPGKSNRKSKSNSPFSRRHGVGVALGGVVMLGTMGGIGYWYSNTQVGESYAAQMAVSMPAVAEPANRLANATTNHANTPANVILRPSPPQPASQIVTPAQNVTAENVAGQDDGESDLSSIAPGSASDGVAEVYQVGPGEVALTFDDGPTPYTQDILNTLNHYHVHGTFFFVGNRISKWSAAVKSVIASGSVVGNHSESHSDLVKLSPDKQESEIALCTQAIETFDNQPITLFRPPYGAFNKETLSLLKADHYALALWNRDPRDWAAHSPNDIVQAVLANHPSGGVFDLHDTKMTAQALPAIIEGLQKQNLKLVVLSSQ